MADPRALNNGPDSSGSFVRDNRYKLFAVGAIGTFMGTLDGSILNVALPTIADSFACDIHIVAWVTLAYLLTMISLMMMFGAWTERKGYSFAYRFAYGFFTVGSLLAALSFSIWSLIAARVIQAVGASMFQTIGTGMVTTVFPPQERGKGIGMMVMMVSAGLMVGPLVGGLLLSVWPWQSIFVINVPIGLVGLGLTLKYFGRLGPSSSQRPVRVAGAVAISITLAAGMIGLTQISDHPVGDVRVWGWGLVALVALLAFLTIEADPDRALIGARLFFNRQFATSLAAMVAMFIAMSGTLVLIPFYLERVKGLEPGAVGLFLIVLPVMMFILAPLSGRASDRIGYRALTTVGLLTMLSGLYFLSRVDPNTSSLYVVLALVAVGGGVGIFNTPNSSAFMGSVGGDQRAIASGLLAAGRNIGMATGIAVATSLFSYFQNRFSGQGSGSQVFVLGFRSVLHIEMIIGAVGVPLCLFRLNRSRP
jgi:EmrB/QacA subfamily drug resistance transporter